MRKNELPKHRGNRMSPALLCALGHPVRRQILRTLHAGKGSRSPAELAETEIAAELSSLSYHMRALGELGVTRLTRTEHVRGSTKHYYTSNVAKHEQAKAILTDTARADKALRRPKEPKSSR